MFEAKSDYEIAYLLAKKLGFADELFKHIARQERRTGRRRHPARAQPRHLDHRLHRPVPGAAQAAHGAPGPVRPHHADGHERAGEGRVLRPALAVLGHAGDEASRHAAALRPVQDHRRRRLAVPRALGRRARGQEPACRELLPEGLADQGRLSRDDRRGARQARLRRPAHAAGKGHHRRRRRRQLPSGAARDQRQDASKLLQRRSSRRRRRRRDRTRKAAEAAERPPNRRPSKFPEPVAEGA